MKKTILLLLTLSLILGVFSSCSHKTVDPIDDQTSSSPSEDTSTANTTEETNDTNQSENTESDERLPDIDGTTEPNIIKYVTGYELKKVDDQWYMVFDSYNHNPAAGAYHPPEGWSFESIVKIRDDILNHRLTLKEMNTIIAYFDRDEIGVPIFDLDEFYIPNIEGDTVVVDDFSFQYRCFWENGQEYIVSFYKDIDDNDGVTTEKDIDLNFWFVKTTKERYDTYIKQNSEKSVKTVQNSAENSVIYVTAGTSAGKNYYEAHIYISKGENYYFYLIDSFDEIPDDETLLSYGIEKYQE